MPPIINGKIINIKCDNDSLQYVHLYANLISLTCITASYFM